MYKVELQGNYNIFIKDLNFEFTPSKSSKIFSDNEFEGSKDILIFLDAELKATKIDKVASTKTVEHKPIANFEVQEVKAKEEETQVVNATNASKTNSENSVANTKTLMEEKMGEAQDTKEIINATGAAKKSWNDPANTKTLAEEKFGEIDNNVIDATDASSINNTQNTSIEENKSEPIVADEQPVTTKVTKKATTTKKKTATKKKVTE